MSIICIEDELSLPIAKQAFAVTTVNIPTYAAICEEHYNQIPADARSKERFADGIDIHFLFGQPNGLSEITGEPMIDTLSLRGTVFGDYRFSISRELARTILPASLNYILKLESQQ